MPRTLTADSARRWEVEEIEALALTGKVSGRSPFAIAAKRSELRAAHLARQRCGAFLPDNGVPYRARAARIAREFAA